MKKLFLIPLMLLATPVPDAVFDESLLLTSGTLGNMGTRIPEWPESLGASRETKDGEEAAASHCINTIAGGQSHRHAGR